MLLLSHFEVIVCFLISYSNQKFVPFLDGYWSYYHLQSSLVRNRSIHFALGLVDSSFFMQRSLSPAGRIFVDLYKRNTFSRVLSSKFYIRENTKNSKKLQCILCTSMWPSVRLLIAHFYGVLLVLSNFWYLRFYMRTHAWLLDRFPFYPIHCLVGLASSYFARFFCIVMLDFWKLFKI